MVFIRLGAKFAFGEGVLWLSLIIWMVGKFGKLLVQV